MARKLLSVFVLMATVVSITSALPTASNWQFPKLVEAACLVTNTTTGKQKHNEVCKCSEDKTVACDVGPIKNRDLEMTFCNKLESQTVDDLYILNFACKSGVDKNCGPGTVCDLGPLTYEGTEYYLCIFTSSPVNVDMSDKCLPEMTKMMPALFGDSFGQSPFGGLGGGFGLPVQGGFTSKQKKPKSKKSKNNSMFSPHNMPMFPQGNMPMFADDDVSALQKQNVPKNPQPNIPMNPPQNIPKNPQPSIPMNPPQNIPKNPQPSIPMNPPQNIPKNPQPNIPMNPPQNMPQIPQMNIPSFPQMPESLQEDPQQNMPTDPFQNMFQDQDFDFPQWGQGMGGFFRQLHRHFPW